MKALASDAAKAAGYTDSAESNKSASATAGQGTPVVTTVAVSEQAGKSILTGAHRHHQRGGHDDSRSEKPVR